MTFLNLSHLIVIYIYKNYHSKQEIGVNKGNQQQTLTTLFVCVLYNMGNVINVTF